jgi:hypothetical protein
MKGFGDVKECHHASTKQLIDSYLKLINPIPMQLRQHQYISTSARDLPA